MDAILTRHASVPLNVRQLKITPVGFILTFRSPGDLLGKQGRINFHFTAHESKLSQVVSLCLDKVLFISYIGC
ncbi:MAG: hypothetical protein ACI959_000541 [Limisphaerales bacterium]